MEHHVGTRWLGALDARASSGALPKSSSPLRRMPDLHHGDLDLLPTRVIVPGPDPVKCFSALAPLATIAMQNEGMMPSRQMPDYVFLVGISGDLTSPALGSSSIMYQMEGKIL